MDARDVCVRPARDHLERREALAVRVRVFVEEHGDPIEDEPDGWDASARHFVAVADGRVIGAGRLFFPEFGMGQIGRVAVLPQHRGRGVGEALIRAMIDHARALSCREVRLNARESTTGFYQRFGMEETGDRFVEAGVPHRTMRLDLREAPAARPQASGS